MRQAAENGRFELGALADWVSLTGGWLRTREGCGLLTAGFDLLVFMAGLPRNPPPQFKREKEIGSAGSLRYNSGNMTTCLCSLDAAAEKPNTRHCLATLEAWRAGLAAASVRNAQIKRR